jgi:tetratricopeptide (TPR) repeat protein
MRRSQLSSRFASSFVCLAAFAANAGAQQLAPHQIDAQIDYARGLATSWQFIDLAQGVLDGLEVAGGLSPSQAEGLALARSEVFASGARTVATDAQREPLFDQALDGYRAFLDSYPASSLLGKARRDYIVLANDYATHMSNMLAEAVGDERERISGVVEKRLTAVLSDSASAIGDLEEVAERTESQERQYWSLRLDRGRLLLRLGRAIEDGEAYLSLGEEELGAIVFDATEDAYQLQGFMILGEVQLALGRPTDAADTFAYVLQSSIPMDRAEWTTQKEFLEPTQIQFRWFYVESAMVPLLDAYLATGQTERAANAGLHLFNCTNGERLQFSPTGQLAAVAAARTLFEAGGWVGGTASNADYRWFQTVEDAETAGFATRSLRSALEFSLTVALDMAERGIGLAQSRAKALIADLIDSPGITFGPDVLFEAARGSFEAKDYVLATSAFRRVVGATAGNEADARLWGAKTSWYIGECFRRQGRDLEAALAFHHGITRWRGDAEYDARNVQAAHAAIGRAMKVDPEAAVFVQLRDEIGAILRSMPEAGKDVAWDFAKRKFDEASGEKDADKARRLFGEAVDLFVEVPIDSPNFGAARARIGVAQYLSGDANAATEAFDSFEAERAGATEPALRAKYDVALREVRYFQGQIAIDAKDWRTAFEIYSQYPTQFPDERAKHDIALALAVEAAVALGDMEKALEITRRLAKEFPDSTNTLRASSAIFTPLYADYRETEEGSDERAALLPVLTEIVALRNKLATKPTFDLLRLESNLYLEYGRFEQALSVLERIVAAYESDPDTKIKDSVQKFVKPDIGVVLVELKRLPEAHAVLSAIVPSTEDESAKRPPEAVVEAYIKSVCGWPMGDPAKPEVLAGVGGAAEIEKAYLWATKLTAAGVRDTGSNTPAWFESRFAEFWALYQWGKVDSAKMESVRKSLTTLTVDLGSEFKALEDMEGGSKALAARYLWLKKLVQ